MNDARVIYRDMPPCIRGLSIRCFEDGEVFYTIVINARLPCEQQRQTLLHEINHIRHDDFESCHCADRIEAIRH